MCIKNKRIVLLMLVLLLVITLFSGCGKEEPRSVSLDDRPYVAYMKQERQTKVGAVYSLKISSFEGANQSIALGCISLSAGAQGEILGFEIKREDLWHTDLYFLERSGESRLVAEDISLFELSRNGYSFLCVLRSQSGEWIYRKYSPEGDFFREETIEGGEDIFSWEFNSTGDIMLFAMKESGDEDEAVRTFHWKDVSIYKDGQMTKVAEKSVISEYNQSISSDGAILYLSDGISEEGEDPIGTLYRKKLDGEAEKVIEASTWKFAISNDGELIASIVLDDEGNEVLFYQYAGQESVFVENIVQFEMSRDSNILYYLVGDKTDWQLDLFKVLKGEEPAMVADNVANIVEMSIDGKSVAYVANFDSEEHRADLYIAREGEQIEFVDSDIYTSDYLGWIITSAIKLYYDGTAIAYLKYDRDRDGKLNDLFVKEQGKEPVKIDEDVILEFDFLK